MGIMESVIRGTLAFTIVACILYGFSYSLSQASGTIEEIFTSGMNETEKQDYYDMLNQSSIDIYYENITILDKQFTNDWVEDDYDITYRNIETGYVSKMDNMQLFYDVEIGKSYNISTECGYKSIVCEI